jgi:hypothetical protein
MKFTGEEKFCQILTLFNLSILKFDFFLNFWYNISKEKEIFGINHFILQLINSIIKTFN